jgi:hypothetical protein
MKIIKLTPIRAGDNPLMHDHFHMGTKISSNFEIIHHTHPNEKAKYLIIVDKTTGERIKIFPDHIPTDPMRSQFDTNSLTLK